MTHFGAFVDVGVNGKAGLLHSSKMKGLEGRIRIGCRLTVRIAAIDVGRERIGLEFVNF